MRAMHGFALAASAGLVPGDAVIEGGQRLVDADGLLEAGNFAAAIPELRQASQSFRTAIDDGRRELAATRAALEAERKTEQAQRLARAASETDSRAGDSLPPVSASDRADVKLVTIPAGSFLYGCDGEAGRACPSSEAAGQRAELGAFRIDRTEVRVSEYRHCVERGCVRAARGRERLQLERARPRRPSRQLHRLGSGRDLLRLDRQAASDRAGVGEGRARYRRTHLSVGQRRTVVRRGGDERFRGRRLWRSFDRARGQPRSGPQPLRLVRHGRQRPRVDRQPVRSPAAERACCAADPGRTTPPRSAPPIVRARSRTCAMRVSASAVRKERSSQKRARVDPASRR